MASVDILPFLGHRDLDLPYSDCEEVYLLVFWSILLKIERDLYLLKVDRVFFGNDNMSKIYERLMSTITPQGKKLGLVRSPKLTLSGEDSTWIVERLEIPPIVDSLLLVFPFFCYMMK